MRSRRFRIVWDELGCFRPFHVRLLFEPECQVGGQSDALAESFNGHLHECLIVRLFRNCLTSAGRSKPGAITTIERGWTGPWITHAVGARRLRLKPLA